MFGEMEIVMLFCGVEEKEVVEVVEVFQVGGSYKKAKDPSLPPPARHNNHTRWGGECFHPPPPACSRPLLSLTGPDGAPKR